MDKAFQTRIQELTAQFNLRAGRETAADAGAFVSLMNSQYTRKLTPAYYFWQFFGTPSPRACLMAELNGRVVAAYGLWALSFRTPQSCCMGLATDLIISPEFRRTGLFLRLEMEMENIARALGCAGIYAAPNEAAYQPRLSTLGWHALAPRMACTAPTSLAPLPSVCVITAVDKFDKTIATVVERFQKGHPNRVMCERQADYLNWRLAAHPHHRYALFVAHLRGQLFGYLVLKVFKDPQTKATTGDIVDLLWAQDSPEALRDMLRFALVFFHERGVPKAFLWLQSGTILDDIARAAGFTPANQVRRFCCKVLDENHRKLEEGSRWYLTMLDAEIY